jgi:polysaccharide chain length determinant protein (PEP-CTERM system associated)
MTPRLDPLFDQIRGVWRFRWHALAVAVPVALIGWLVVFSLPDLYEAQAKVLVDTRTALKPMLEGLAVDPNVGVELSYVRQSLLSGPQLQALAQQVGALPADSVGPKREQALLDALRKRIDITAEENQALLGTPQDSGSTTFGITYDDVNQNRALALVKLLTSTLVNETVGGSMQSSLHAQAFLKSQIDAYEKRLQNAEQRLAAFKSQHLGLMPTEQGGYFDELERESEAIEDVKTKLLVAQSRRAELEKELHGNAAVAASDATPVVGPNGTVSGDTLTQIQLVQERLNQLLLTYTDKYPDVIAARQELARLRARRAAELAALKRGDAGAAAETGASTNPVYQGIELELNKANVDIADLESELKEHEQKEQSLHKLLDATPQLQAQYAQLSRDYDINKKQYAALLASYDKARLGQQAGTAGAVRFALVQPPVVSFTPVSPKRIELIAVVLVLALGLGGALAYWLDQLKPVVGSPSALRELTGVPVVAVVGSAFPTRTHRLIRAQVRRFSFALGFLLVGFIVAVVLSHMGVRLGSTMHLPLIHA